MSRPSFHRIMMDFAIELAERSTCARAQVGCVITSIDFRSVYAIGYNGNYEGGPNDCDVHGPEAVGKCGCLHAEENAVINCDVSRHLPKLVFSTTLPCRMCAKRLINLGGVMEVFYGQNYRTLESVDLFASRHIRCISLDEYEGVTP